MTGCTIKIQKLQKMPKIILFLKLIIFKKSCNLRGGPTADPFFYDISSPALRLRQTSPLFLQKFTTLNIFQ